VQLLTRTPRIDATGAAHLLDARAAVVIDVRQTAEWKSGHIKGATHIPLSQLSRRLHHVPQGKTIITVCRSGHRSALAARTLARAGHDVVNLKGGISAWTRAGLPLSTSNVRNR
jgi:rhodanese-related sulfurtransferase